MPRWVVAVAFLLACRGDHGQAEKRARNQAPPRDAAALAPAAYDPFVELRNAMVDRVVRLRDIRDPRVIAAMRLTPRHAFVPPAVRDQAYDDRPVSIGFDSTASAPSIVAAMTEAAHVKAGDKVLEVGTGSGYQAAVLAMMGAHVFTIEIRDGLAERTRKVLATNGFAQVTVKSGDGYDGLPAEAPFDAIVVTCAAPEVPRPLLDQLRMGGRLVMPLGESEQAIMEITKTPDGTTREIVMDGVMFGPMVGEIEYQR